MLILQPSDDISGIQSDYIGIMYLDFLCILEDTAPADSVHQAQW